MQNILQDKFLLDDTYLTGSADLRGLVDKTFGDYQYGISICKKLDDRIIDSINNGPTLEYYNYYNKINNELADKALEIKKELEFSIRKATPSTQPLLYILYLYLYLLA